MISLLAVNALLLCGIFWEAKKIRKHLEKLVPMRFEIEQAETIKERLQDVA